MLKLSNASTGSEAANYRRVAEQVLDELVGPHPQPMDHVTVNSVWADGHTLTANCTSEGDLSLRVVLDMRQARVTALEVTNGTTSIDLTCYEYGQGRIEEYRSNLLAAQLATKMLCVHFAAS